METLKKTVIVLSIQLLVALFFYEIGWYLWNAHAGPYKPDLGWGITFYFAIWIYSAISVITSLVVAKAKRTKTIVVILLIGYFIFTCFFIETYLYHPFKTLLLLTAALSGILASLLAGVRYTSTAANRDI